MTGHVGLGSRVEARVGPAPSRLSPQTGAVTDWHRGAIGAPVNGFSSHFPGIHLRRAPPPERPVRVGPFVTEEDIAASQQTTLHSITSSARASNSGGTVRPSAFAVLRLITSSTSEVSRLRALG